MTLLGSSLLGGRASPECRRSQNNLLRTMAAAAAGSAAHVCLTTSPSRWPTSAAPSAPPQPSSEIVYPNLRAVRVKRRRAQARPPRGLPRPWEVERPSKRCKGGQFGRSARRQGTRRLFDGVREPIRICRRVEQPHGRTRQVSRMRRQEPRRTDGARGSPRKERRQSDAARRHFFRPPNFNERFDAPSTCTFMSPRAVSSNATQFVTSHLHGASKREPTDAPNAKAHRRKRTRTRTKP